MAVVAGMDRYGNLVGMKTRETSIQKEVFMSFLTEVRSHYVSGKIYMVLDNLNMHHMIVVGEYAEKLDIEFLFLPVYTSWYNPTEHVW